MSVMYSMFSSPSRSGTGFVLLCALIVAVFPAMLGAQTFSLDINGPRDICSYEQGNYTAVSDVGMGFSWRVAKGTIVSGQYTNAITVEWVSGGVDTITVTAVSSSGATAEETIIVDVHGITRPVISADGPTAMCVGSTVGLSVPVGYSSYLWSNGSTNRSILVTDAGTYSVTVTNSYGCSATSVPLKVNTLIPPKPEISVQGSLTFCEGESVTLDAGEGFVSYEWSNGSYGRYVTIYEAGLYSVTVTDIYGCHARSSGVTVTVYQNPATPSITQVGSSLRTGAATMYQWYVNGEPISGASEQTYQPVQSGLYTVRIANANGCTADSDPYLFRFASMHIAVPTLNVDLHRSLQLPLVIVHSENLEDVSPGRFTAVLRFNKNALYPQDVLSTIDGDDRIVTYSGTYTRGDTVLGRITCTPLWSDMTQAPVYIDSLSFASNDVYVTTEEGMLHFLVCNEGGTRLFLNNGTVGLAQNHPNPFNASTSIEYSVIEKGRTVLAVYDMLGRTIATLVDATIEPGTYRVPFDAGALPSGAYLYVLQTPTQRFVRLMEVAK